MLKRTEAIKAFLEAKTHKDLAAMYNHNMEVQVNVARDGGQRIDGDFKGAKWHGYTDGVQTWKPIRIPYKASTEPEYEDVNMSYSLEEHAEGIGMTGWDWFKKISKHVAFDFDAISGHSDKHQRKMTEEELQHLIKIVSDVEWVTLRKSTGGKGLHLYVVLGIEVTTKTHTEHAGLARSILGKLSALTGFDFKAKVDTCGGNMWIWHRKMAGTKGLELLKSGRPLTDVPPSWKEHINVISGRSKKTLPTFAAKMPHIQKLFEELSGQRASTPLDEEHKKLLNYLNENNCLWWWDSDRHMLVCNTYDLKMAHEALGFKGIFDTEAKGSEKGVD